MVRYGLPCCVPNYPLLRRLALMAALAGWCTALPAQAPAPRKLTELSLEELMQVEVTTVSKHAEKLSAAPAAVFVLTNDDLRRSAALNLPQALRLVPGIQVGAVGAHDWALSARGFADVFANKLLVLRDGRSIYTPLFSGVFWDAQDTVLEDVERIEVVRGPGATLWGANAVNGVINVLSRSARDTQGLLTSVAAGTDPEVRGVVRYGGIVDPQTHYRVFAKHTRYAESELVGGGDARDAARMSVAGFRVDRHGNLSLTLQGDAYTGREEQVFIVPTRTPPFVGTMAGDIRLSGGNVLARSTHVAPTGTQIVAQMYFDYTHRKSPVFDNLMRTFDFELHGRAAWGSRQEVTMGAGFRTARDSVRNTEVIALTPPRRRMDLWSAFIQDDITIHPERLHLVLGTKFEHNDFTGAEIQPGARALWTPARGQTAWASVARAVRTPSRAEDDVGLRQITSTPGVSLHVRGDRGMAAEELVAYEAGYRFRLREKVSVDAAVFYNDYARLRTTELDSTALITLMRLANPALPPPGLPVILTARPGNGMKGSTHGGEIALNTQLTPAWRLRTSYALLLMNLSAASNSSDTSSGAIQGRSPRHQASLWSQYEIGRGWQFDCMLRHVDRLPAIHIPAVTELDLRIGWRPADRWELALVGQNLLSPHHPEFAPSSVVTPRTEVRRRAYLEIRYGY